MIDVIYFTFLIQKLVRSKGGQKSSFLTPQIGPMHIGASRPLNLPKIHIFPMDFNDFVNPFGVILTVFRRHFGRTLRTLASICAYEGGFGAL